jgi:hypothetical protein
MSLDSVDATESYKTVNRLPSSLIIRQLLMLVLKSWKSGAELADGSSSWDTCEALVDGIEAAARLESLESWERTVSATLFFATNVVQLHLENSENRPAFLEMAKTVTEILRITLQKARELSATHSKETDLDADVMELDHDVTDNDSFVDEDTTNDVIREDVVGSLDKSCAQKPGEKTVENDRQAFARTANMVFEHDVFRNLFRHETWGEDAPGLHYVSQIISDCIAELLRHFHDEILKDKTCKYLDAYVLRVAQSVKKEAFGAQNDGMCCQIFYKRNKV